MGNRKIERTPSPEPSVNKLDQRLNLNPPPKNRRKMSIEKRNGIDSHLIRDCYNSKMHMLRKDPSKREDYLEEQTKTQYWKSLINKKWDSLRCRNLQQKGESFLKKFKKQIVEERKKIKAE